MSKYRTKLTKIERKQSLSKLLRWTAKTSWNQRSFVVFEKHLNLAEDESLPLYEREIAAKKIDLMFYRRMKKT